MNKRKLVLLASALCIVAILAVGSTLAYFTDGDEATNTFTVGNVDIDLQEPKWDESGKEDSPEVYPTEALAKDPQIENIGANPCFVRLKITGWDSLIEAGLSESRITYRTNYVEGALGTDWVLHTDGYYYYTKVLAVGETTTPVFDQIVMPADLVNGNGETTYHIVVNAYAVQAQGAKPSWSAVQQMTVEEIAAWFATCMPAE